MSRFGSRHDPFRACKLHSRLEGDKLTDGHGFDVAVIVRGADMGRHTVITQASGVDSGWYEGVPQGVHLDDGSHHGRVAEVEGIFALGQRGTGGRFDSYETCLLALGKIFM
jgi:hypothetical protein